MECEHFLEKLFFLHNLSAYVKHPVPGETFTTILTYLIYFQILSSSMRMIVLDQP